MSKRYAIESVQEAVAYWQHPVLGLRLKECIELMLKHEGRFTPKEVLGSIDRLNCGHA